LACSAIDPPGTPACLVTSSIPARALDYAIFMAV
jgi:hypothetical protein